MGLMITVSQALTNCRRLKEKPLSVTPIDLEDDQRARGLTHLLAVGLRILALIKHVARSQLDKAEAKLRDLYASNPKWATKCPTTEMLLWAFKNMFLSFVQSEDLYYHITVRLWACSTSHRASILRWHPILQSRLENERTGG